jgi:hypothetical protein
VIARLIFNSEDIRKVPMIQHEDKVWRDLISGIPIEYSNDIPQGEVVGVDKDGNIVALWSLQQEQSR